MLARWPGGLIEYHGMTEGGGTCMLLAHEHPDKLHTIGRPIPGNEMLVIDEVGAVLRWMWDAKDHHSYEMLVEALRETAFWDRWFEIVEILPGVEDAYARNYHREVITA